MILTLSPSLDERENLLHLHVVIVVVDVRTHLDLLDLLRLLRLAGEIGLFLGLVFELADVEELAHRRIGVGRDLDQVEADFGGLLDRFGGEHHARYSRHSRRSRAPWAEMNSLKRGPFMGGAIGRRVMGGRIAFLLS